MNDKRCPDCNSVVSILFSCACNKIKYCKERQCRFNYKGECTNTSFDTEEPIPCYWEDT